MASLSFARVGLLFGATLLLSASAGCERSGFVPDPEIAYADYAASIETAVCEWRTRCNLDASVDSCRELQFVDRDDPYISAAIAAETVLYHGDAAYRCVDEYAARSCERDPAEDPIPSCAEIFEGQVAPEDPCLVDEECVENGVCGVNPNDCVDDAQCCAGACRLLPGAVPEGESCANQFARCEAGTYCAVDPMTFQPTVCTANRPIGALCEFNDGCVDEGFCNFSTGYCEAKRGAGEECWQHSWCAENHRCIWDQVTFLETCVPVTIGAALGEPCTPDVGSEACADVGAWCSNTTTTCVLLPGPGEPCIDGYRCAPYAECGDTTCVALPRAGEVCWGSCAGGLFCDWDNAMTCAVPEFSGDGCEVPGEPFDAKSDDKGN
ncbi:MAG: hypothetical protein R3A79_28115 [Nannocystaceae bacterium]